MEYKQYEEIAEKLNQKIYERNSYWFYKQIKKLMPTLNHIVKNFDYEKVEFDKNDLNLGEMQTLVLDFLRDLDPELEEKALNVLEDIEHTVLYVGKPQDVAKSNSVGLRGLIGKNGRPLKNSPKVEIALHPQNSEIGLVVIGHEYGHILSQRIQKRIKQKSHWIGEIESLFIEKIFADWLLKKKIISKESLKKMDVHWKSLLIARAQVLVEEFDILNRLQRPTSAEDLQKIEKELQDKNRFGWIEVLKHRISEMIKDDKDFPKDGEYVFKYLVGEIVASALYEDYKINPKETIANFKEFLSHNAEYDFYPSKQVEQDGKIINKFVLEQSEVDKCFSTLLGENYKEKLEKTINNLSVEKTV